MLLIFRSFLSAAHQCSRCGSALPVFQCRLLEKLQCPAAHFSYSRLSLSTAFTWATRFDNSFESVVGTTSRSCG